jgi:UDP-N-acetylmuramyl tripeptide synthase
MPPASVPLPFEDSRRLTGANRHFASPAAVLEARVPVDAALETAWRARIAEAATALGWPSPRLALRRHAAGAELAVAAPHQRLFTTVEANEWALCAALVDLGRADAAALDAALAQAAEDNPLPGALAGPALPVVAPEAALARLVGLAAREPEPRLEALLAAAAARGVPWLLDDEQLTLGHGARGRSHSLDSLPTPDRVAWERLGPIPLALVTGSNGKTTTVRLIAAALDAAGLVSGHSCTDGVSVGGRALGSGDYSGPQGARRVLRDARCGAAVLETARGGMLRRGLAVGRADCAVVTNVSADHFGEYGVHDLADLADAKLTVARVLPPHGLLVLPADDPLLHARGAALAAEGQRIGWSAATLAAARAAGGVAACGVHDGRLVLEQEGVAHDLGAADAFPIAAGGLARFNLANLAAAALAAAALGVAPPTIAAAFARFGADPDDNRGRLMRFARGGATVIVDYAHNADGLARLAPVVAAARGAGRLALLLGHAGNRRDEDIAGVVGAALALRPDLVVVKEIAGMARGRDPGALAALIVRTLGSLGHPAAATVVELDELAAARRALAWAQPGDVVLLLVHGAAARDALLAELVA